MKSAVVNSIGFENGIWSKEATSLYVEEYLTWSRGTMEEYPTWLQRGYAHECTMQIDR